MKKILVVEDDKMLQNVISKKLQNSGFEVEIANDGSEALEKVKNKTPDLILLDIIMPVMDGISFLKAIKRTEFKNIPVIVLTNLNDDKSVDKAIQEGATNYLIKVNYPLEKLLSVVKQKLIVT